MPPRPHAVTFDCWSTLIVEAAPGWGPSRRARILAERADVDDARAGEAIGVAWREHQLRWHRGQAFTAHHMALHALDLLGRELDARALAELTIALESEALNHEVRALPGAQHALEALAEAGIRRALVCDTGFSPGRVVRELLVRAGLFDLLEAAVFSDELGVPKPSRRPFEEALAALGAPAERAIHVGDLRRSDVAGARGMGMGSVRLALHHDDSDDQPGDRAGVIDCRVAGCTPPCPRPEADVVARSYDDVLRALGLP